MSKLNSKRFEGLYSALNTGFMIVAIGAILFTFNNQKALTWFSAMLMIVLAGGLVLSLMILIPLFLINKLKNVTNNIFMLLAGGFFLLSFTQCRVGYMATGGYDRIEMAPGIISIIWETIRVFSTMGWTFAMPIVITLALSVICLLIQNKLEAKLNEK